MKRLICVVLALTLLSLPVMAAEQVQSFNYLYFKSGGLSGTYQQQLALRILTGKVYTLTTTNAGITLDCRGMRFLTIITGSGATATYSKVDTPTTTSHDSATDATVSADTDTSVEIKWPFMRVSTAGGSTRCACVP